MAQYPAQPGAPKWLWVLIIVLFIFLASSAFNLSQSTTSRSALQDADFLFFTFQSLARGDIISAISALVEGVPLVGLFLILFAITYYLFSTVLKSLFRSRSSAITLSLILSIYALVNPTIYSLLIDLNAFVVAFLVFSVLIVFLWGLSREGISSVKESNKLAREEFLKGDLSRKQIKELKKQFKELQNE